MENFGVQARGSRLGGWNLVFAVWSPNRKGSPRSRERREAGLAVSAGRLCRAGRGGVRGVKRPPEGVERGRSGPGAGEERTTGRPAGTAAGLRASQ